jgi:hypothetical protein
MSDAPMTLWSLRVYVCIGNKGCSIGRTLDFLPVFLFESAISLCPTYETTYGLMINLMVNMYETPIDIR